MIFFYLINSYTIQLYTYVSLENALHAEWILGKLCHVNSFKTFVDGLHSERMYEDKAQ